VEIDEDPISLDELARAFAQVMGNAPEHRAAESQPPPVAEAATAPEEPQHQETHEPALESEDPRDDAGPVTPLSILEAMLFVGDRGNRPLTAARVAELMRGVEQGEVAGLVQELNRRYSTNACPYYIAENSDGYRMTLRAPFHPLREKFFGRTRAARLSQAAIDVLAIVAYQQPLTADEINIVRSKPSGGVLSQLVHRGLLRIERQPGKRRVVQYFTTDRFLSLFGLQTLADLPQSEELERQ
jgi:segregation and condensation protein B